MVALIEPENLESRLVRGFQRLACLMPMRKNYKSGNLARFRLALVGATQTPYISQGSPSGNVS